MFWAENAGEISTCPKEKNCFYWKVPNYFANQPSTETNFETIDPRIITSPWFSAFNRTWRLALILNSRSSNIYLGFFLWIMASFNEIPKIKVQLKAFNDDAKVYKECEGFLDINGRFGSWEFLYLPSLSVRKVSLSPAGVLPLLCVMEEEVPVNLDIPHGSECLGSAPTVENDDSKNDEVSENTNESELKGVDKLLKNFKSLFLEEQSSDATLKVEGRDFKVHRAILIARSSVFASMFQHDTKDKTSGIVKIPDCTAAAFEAFLLYLYTASTDTMSSNNVLDLYYAADKYQVNDLKSKCIEYMGNNLSCDNFCDIMTLSLMHCESGLQEKATDFFCENFKSIIKTVQWQKYLREHPTEANELFIKAAHA